MQFLRLAASLFLLGFAVPSVALTLGSPQGAVWIGRPLDLVVPLSLGEGEGGDSLCVQAELVQGGSRVDDKRVTVSLETGARAGETRLRVRSTMAIEEPVVQLSVRAGCTMNSTRQFVLLADMPSDVAAVPVATRSLQAAVPSAPDETRRGTRTVSPGDSSGDAGASTSAPPRRAVVRRPASEPAARNSEARARPAAPAARRSASTAPAAPASAAVAAPSAASAAAPAVPRTAASASGGARLQLDAFDPAAARNPALAASAAATAPSLVNPDAAVTAALAAASAAANTEELQRANDRMKTLEATLAALREQSAQNQRLLLEMRGELAEARDSRYRNPLVYVLGLLLLLALIGLALLWRIARNASRSAWWGDGMREGAVSLPQTPDDVGGVPLAGAPAASRTGPFGTALVAADEADEPSETLPPLPEDPVTPTRYVNTEELFDVQQQSDFFVSLGQHEQAIAVLSEHIADNPETSALAYLDLLRIYHSLDRRDDYARVGQEFERAFNASVPAFESFSESGRGLEYYRSTLARIEAQWPRSGTLNLIEELVFRKPGMRGDESFDLAAYRELLLLYAVAKEVIDPDSAPPTPVTPLSFLDTHEARLEPTQPQPLDLDPTTEPAALSGGDHNAPDAPLPSLYGAIDETLAHDTVIAAHPSAREMTPPFKLAVPAARATLAAEPNPPARHDDNSLSFDNTSMETLETLRGELEDGERSSPPATDVAPMPSLRLDLELFDPAIEAEIAPRRRR